jgi:hypothetical protein
MAAQIDLGRRSKPAQPIIVVLGNEKGCLSQVVFGGNSLEHSII